MQILKILIARNGCIAWELHAYVYSVQNELSKLHVSFD
jgi:hypothetical protein